MTAWIKESDFLRRRGTGLLCFIVNTLVISAKTHKDSCVTGSKNGADTAHIRIWVLTILPVITERHALSVIAYVWRYAHEHRTKTNPGFR